MEHALFPLKHPALFLALWCVGMAFAVLALKRAFGD